MGKQNTHSVNRTKQNPTSSSKNDWSTLPSSNGTRNLPIRSRALFESLRPPLEQHTNLPIAESSSPDRSRVEPISVTSLSAGIYGPLKSTRKRNRSISDLETVRKRPHIERISHPSTPSDSEHAVFDAYPPADTESESDLLEVHQSAESSDGYDSPEAHISTALDDESASPRAQLSAGMYNEHESHKSETKKEPSTAQALNIKRSSFASRRLPINRLNESTEIILNIFESLPDSETVLRLAYTSKRNYSIWMLHHKHIVRRIIERTVPCFACAHCLIQTQTLAYQLDPHIAPFSNFSNRSNPASPLHYLRTLDLYQANANQAHLFLTLLHAETTKFNPSYIRSTTCPIHGPTIPDEHPSPQPTTTVFLTLFYLFKVHTLSLHTGPPHPHPFFSAPWFLPPTDSTPSTHLQLSATRSSSTSSLQSLSYTHLRLASAILAWCYTSLSVEQQLSLGIRQVRSPALNRRLEGREWVGEACFHHWAEEWRELKRGVEGLYWVGCEEVEEEAVRRWGVGCWICRRERGVDGDGELRDVVVGGGGARDGVGRQVYGYRRNRTCLGQLAFERRGGL